jgi:hypothetical protein
MQRCATVFGQSRYPYAATGVPSAALVTKTVPERWLILLSSTSLGVASRNRGVISSTPTSSTSFVPAVARNHRDRAGPPDLRPLPCPAGGVTGPLETRLGRLSSTRVRLRPPPSNPPMGRLLSPSRPRPAPLPTPSSKVVNRVIPSPAHAPSEKCRSEHTRLLGRVAEYPRPPSIVRRSPSDVATPQSPG